MRTNRYNKQKKQPIYFWPGKTVKATSNLSRTGYPRNSAALPINKIQRRTKDPSGGSMNFNYSAQRPLEVSSGAQNGRRQLAGSFSFFFWLKFNSIPVNFEWISMWKDESSGRGGGVSSRGTKWRPSISEGRKRVILSGKLKMSSVSRWHRPSPFEPVPIGGSVACRLRWPIRRRPAIFHFFEIVQSNGVNCNNSQRYGRDGVERVLHISLDPLPFSVSTTLDGTRKPLPLAAAAGIQSTRNEWKNLGGTCRWDL